MVKWFSTTAPRQLNGKRIILIVLGELIITCKKKHRFLPHTIQKIKTSHRKKIKWVTELNARTKV